MPDSRSVVVSTIAVMSLASTAQAGLLVAPTILGPGLEPAREIIDETIEKQLNSGQVRKQVSDRFLDQKLKECKNSMSCLSKVAQPTEASHVLHVVMARRGNKVLAQITLINVGTSERVKRERTGSGLGLSLIEASVQGAMIKIVGAIKILPEYKSGALRRSASVASATPRSNRVTGSTRVTSSSTRRTTSSASSGTKMTSAASPAGDPLSIDDSAFADPTPAFVEARVPTVRGPNYLAYGAVGLGGVMVVGSGVAFLLSNFDIVERNNTDQTQVARRQELRNSAISKQNVGIAMLGAGALSGGLAALFWVTGWGAVEYPVSAVGAQASTPPPWSVGVGPDGVSASFRF